MDEDICGMLQTRRSDGDGSSERQHVELGFSATTDNLEAVNHAVFKLAQSTGWDAGIQMQIELVLEELITNIINYGYPDREQGHIELFMEGSPEELKIRLEDDGKPYNPLETEEPDFNLSLEEKPIGGLGVYFVRHIMNTMDYRWENGRNIVEVTKSFS